MRRRILPKLLLWVGIPIMLFSSCVDDKYLTEPPPVPDQSFVEEFDTLMSAYNRGWRLVNRSEPIGPTNWNQIGDPQFGLDFTPFSKTGGVGYIECDNFSIAPTAPNTGVISNWIVSPIKIMQNGDKIIFYANSAFVDNGVRLQVRMNTNNTGLNCGRGTDHGDFTTPLLDINPTYDLAPPNAFPDNWTRFEATVYGLDKPTQGRFAFRYFHEAGFADDPADGVFDCVALDSVAYVSKH